MPLIITITVDAKASGPVRLFLDSLDMALSTAGQEVPPGESVKLVAETPVRGCVRTRESGDRWICSLSHDFADTTLLGIARGADGRDQPWEVNGERTTRPAIAADIPADVSFTGSGELHLVPLPAAAGGTVASSTSSSTATRAG